MQTRPSYVRLPLWRLLGGELAWAGKQLLAAPWVLAGLLIGLIGTYLVLGVNAPGPVPETPWRVLLATGVGLLLAAGARAIPSLTGNHIATQNDESPQRRPLAAAIVYASTVVLVTLLVWFVVWLVSAVAT